MSSRVPPPPDPRRDAARPAAPEARLSSVWTEVAWSGRRLRIHHARACAHGPSDRGAPPLVLLHGMASSWRQWRTQMLRLAAEVPVAAVDMPGFGRSEQPRRPLAFGQYAEILELWRQAHGWASLRLVGHSFGGAVAVDWAGRWPERVQTLGLLAPAALYHEWFTAGGGPIRWPLLGALVARPFVWVVSTSWLGPRYFHHLATRFGDIRPDERRDLQWSCRHAREMLRALDFYRFPDLDARLSAIAAPTIVGWGTADRVVPYADAEYYRQRIRRCELRTWEGCGHLPMMERRSECDRLLMDVGEIAGAPAGDRGAIPLGPSAAAPRLRP